MISRGENEDAGVCAAGKQMGHFDASHLSVPMPAYVSDPSLMSCGGRKGSGRGGGKAGWRHVALILPN